MSMYMPAEDMERLADTFDTVAQEESAEQKQTQEFDEETQGVRRRLPMLVVGSVALSAAATAIAFAVRRRSEQQHGARRWLAVNRRTTALSPKVFVMLPLSAYVQVLNRNSTHRRFRLLRKRLGRIGSGRQAFAPRLGRLNALRERVLSSSPR